MTSKDEKPIEVVATANGYYGNKIRVPGEQFTIHGEDAFSENWMEKASKAETPVQTRRTNTGGTDGVVGAEVPKTGQKLSSKERIAAARDLTGRDDITTAKEADAILSAADLAGGSDNDDRSRDFASDPGDDAPIEPIENEDD